VTAPTDHETTDDGSTEHPAFAPGQRMLTLGQVCAWFNVTERHVRKLVERDAIPYRKVGRLLRFPEHELEEWSRPAPRRQPPTTATPRLATVDYTIPRQRRRHIARLPKSLID
jgi:excisionase family DNA binding protein